MPLWVSGKDCWQTQHVKGCHPERSRRTSPTCVTCSAFARSLDFARDDIAATASHATTSRNVFCRQIAATCVVRQRKRRTMALTNLGAVAGCVFKVLQLRVVIDL